MPLSQPSRATRRPRVTSASAVRPRGPHGGATCRRGGRGRRVVRHLEEGERVGDDGSLAQGKPVTIGADDSLEEALRTMSEHQVRRLPVIDGHDLVGMLSQSDLAKSLPDDAAGDLIQAISRGS